jgi:predicted phage tail protein
MVLTIAYVGIFLIIIANVLITQAQITIEPEDISGKYDNLWEWEAPHGIVAHYIFQITRDSGDSWITIGTTEVNQYRYISPGNETYQCRVIAVNAAGNQSRPSNISAPLQVKGNPGTPYYNPEDVVE